MKLRKARKLISLITCFSLVLQTFLPFTLALPAYAVDETASESGTVAEPTASPTPEPIISPTVEPTITPIVEVTPTPTSEAVSVGDEKTATFDSVSVGQAYTSKDGKATVIFSEITGLSGNLVIKEITLTPEQITQSGAISDVAYDITSSMADGTFKFDLSLPKPEIENANIEVKYSEDGQDFITSGGVSTTENEVVVTDVNHFTIFVIAGVHLPSDVYINEFSYTPASNQWIELFNSGSEAVNLSGWRLKSNDKETDLSGNISGYGFKTFDVTSLKNPSGNADGDTIYLLNNRVILTTSDAITYYRCNAWWCVGSTPVSSDNNMNGKSIGRSTDGGDTWTSFSSPTRGFTNLGDNTAPVISYSLSQVPNLAGWNNSNITIDWTVTENESPITLSSGCDDVTISTETTGTDYTCSVTSNGGTSSKTVTIKLDKTSPQITIGDYDGTTPTNQNVTVPATTNEGTLNENSHTFTENGSFTFVATDVAGNTTSETVTVLNIDKTPPAVPQYIGWTSDNPITGSDYVRGSDFANYQTCGGYLNYSPMTNLWTPVSDAVSYDREVYSPEGNLVYAHSLTANYINGGGAVDGNTYSIRIRAHDAAGNVSDWSSLCSAKYDITAPDAPILLSPENGIYRHTSDSNFSEWAPVSDQSLPITYYYQSAFDAAFTNIAYPRTAQPGTKIFNPGEPEGTYYWRVQACDVAGNCSPWSEIRSINIDNTLPSVPVNGSPNGTIIPTNNFDFTWGSSVDNSPLTYEYQASQNSIQEGGVLTTGLWKSGILSANMIHSSGAPDGVWYWQVRAIDKAGNQSAWSQIWNVTLDTVSPSTPILIWPVDISTNDNTPLMQWNDSIDNGSGVSGYLYRVYYHCSNPSDFNTCTSVYPNSLGLWLTASEYQAGTTSDGIYYWQVSSQDYAGNQSAWSDKEKVTIDTVAPVITIAPYTTSWTNQDITVTASVNEGSLNTSSHTFTANGSFTFIASDSAGNSSSETVTVSNIDKEMPTGTIVSPVSGAVVKGIISIDATVSDDLGSGVSKVEFSHSSIVPTLIGEDTEAPFSINWDTTGVTDGAHSIYIRVFDIAGNNTGYINIPVTVDNTAPVSTITSPTNSQYFNSAINIGGNTEDINGVAHVALSYADFDGKMCGAYSPIQTLTPEGNTTNYPWSYSWTPSTQGSFCIKAAGTDSVGNEEGSAVVMGITYDTTDPAVSYISPTPNDNQLTNNNDQTFKVSLSEDVASCSLNFGINNGGFEEGNLSNWNTSGNANWYVNSSYKKEGSFSARSGNMSGWNNVSSTLQRSVTTGANSMLTFWWMVSSEGGYDYLSFYLDGVHKNGISGGVDWQKMQYNLGSGVHNLQWTYSKDYSVTSGLDGGYLDDVRVTGGTGESQSMVVDNGNHIATLTLSDMADSIYSYSVSCDDYAGNTGLESTRILTVDTHAPTLSGQTLFDEEWHNEDQLSTFSYTDENGINSGTPVTCTISTEGENQTCSITPNVCDNANNCNTETVTSNGANIDKTNPVVSITTNPASPDAANGWFKTQPEITINVVDQNPLILQYQWDGTEGEWTDFINAIKPATEGVHTLYYRAFDKAENTSGIVSSIIKWDQTEINLAPQNVTADPNPTSGSTSKIKWEAANDNVGIDKYEVKYTLNDPSNPLSYSFEVGSDVREKEIDRLVEGRWTVSVRAFDAAGHSQDSAIDLYVDRTGPAAPALTLVGTGVGTATLSWSSVADAKDYIVWYGNTPGSRLFGARVGLTTSYTVKGLGAGNYYFIVKAVDGAQNQGAESNEVNTGTIIGAPGVAEGTPAEGFTPEVQGVNTDATPSGTQPTPSILGSQTQNKPFAWWWLLLLLIPLYIGVRRASRRK